MLPAAAVKEEKGFGGNQQTTPVCMADVAHVVMATFMYVAKTLCFNKKRYQGMM